MKKNNFEHYPSVSLIKFLTEYVSVDGINEETINKLAKATHKDIKELNIPYVKAVPFEILTDEALASGDIILVADGKSTLKNKRIAPYVRPEILKEKERNQEKEEDKERRGSYGKF